MARATFAQTMDRLNLLIQAGYPVIYIVSSEEARVMECLTRIVSRIRVSQPTKYLWRWYEGIGLERLDNLSPGDSRQPVPWMHASGQAQIQGGGRWVSLPNTARADLALDAFVNVRQDNVPTLTDGLVVFFDLHPYLRSDPLSGAGPLVRPLRKAAADFRKYYEDNRGQKPPRYKTIVIVAPSAVGISSELEHDQIVIDFPLPEIDELRTTFNLMVGSGRLRFPETVPPAEIRQVCGANATPDEYRRLLGEMVAGAGRGLPLDDYKLGLNMFSVEGGALTSTHVEQMLRLKSKAISDRALEYTPHVAVELGGLTAVKEWVRLRKNPVISEDVRRQYKLASPKGVMLCGVSGGGKSQLAKLIAKEFSLALLRLDVGALFGMYVGESEERTRKALMLAEVLAPVVLWIDEIDKAFSGMGGNGDNGVSSRVFGHFLTWLSEKTDSVFVVATANNFQPLLGQFPEFGRKGRFDEIFWVGLPSEEARRTIFEIYLSGLWREGYLIVDTQELAAIQQDHNILDTPPPGDAFNWFIWLLGRPEISGQLTGAEIESAVNGALYERYKLDRASAGGHPFTAKLVVEIVLVARERALYAPNTPDDINMNVLEAVAKSKGWVKV